MPRRVFGSRFPSARRRSTSNLSADTWNCLMVDSGANVDLGAIDQRRAYKQHAQAALLMRQRVSISDVGGAIKNVIGVAQGCLPVFDDGFVEVDFYVTKEPNDTIMGFSTLDSSRWPLSIHANCALTTDGRILPLSRAKGHLF